MHIVDMIYFWARTVPQRLAVIQPSMIMTFQGLADGIESIGERIDRLNLDKREPVAVSIRSPAFMLATIFALLRNGHTVAPVTEQRYPLLVGAGIRHLIYDVRGQVTSGGRNIRFETSWLPPPQQATMPRAYRRRSIENPSVIYFTSGTTGRPKKMVQSGAMLDQVLNHPVTRLAGAHQKVLIMPGLTTAFGFNRACEVLRFGKTVCFAYESMSALALINLFGIEVVIAAAAQALNLADAKTKNRGYRVDTLKAMFFGGGKMNLEGIAHVRNSLCRNVFDYYSSTEASLAAFTAYGPGANTPGATVVPWAKLEIVDEVGRQLPAGAEGIVRVRTPALMENLKAAGPDRISSVRDDWFYPGDIGSLDDEGAFYLSGRNSDVINRGGIKVSGTLVEEIVRSFPKIREAAACGITGPSGLEELWIGVVADEPIDVEQIKMRLSEHTDIRIAPDEIILLDEIPRGELGKVQTPRLKELLLELKRSG